MAAKSSGGTASDDSSGSDIIGQVFGVFLVLINLSLDAYTNQEQEEIFKEGATSLQLMKAVNIWQFIYLGIYLLGGYLLFDQLKLNFSGVAPESSELRYDETTHS